MIPDLPELCVLFRCYLRRPPPREPPPREPLILEEPRDELARAPLRPPLDPLKALLLPLRLPAPDDTWRLPMLSLLRPAPAPADPRFPAPAPRSPAGLAAKF